VSHAGRVEIGDRLDVEAGRTTPAEATTNAIARLLEQIGGA